MFIPISKILNQPEEIMRAIIKRAVNILMLAGPAEKFPKVFVAASSGLVNFASGGSC
jgi:hypothetical protein